MSGKMGQQYSSASEVIVNTASPQSGVIESKMQSEAEQAGPGLVNPTTQNTSSCDVASPQTVDGSAVADVCGAKLRTETDISRMSIRAAIDSFIENCLATSNDETLTDTSHDYGVGVPSCSEGIRSLLAFSKSGSKPATRDSIQNSSDALRSDNKGETKSVKNKENDVVDPEIIIDCDEETISGSSEGKAQTETATGRTSGSSSSPELCVDVQKRKLGELKDGDINEKNKQELKDSKGNTNQKESVNEASLDTSDIPKALATPEKQSFSAFLQDRLKSLDYDQNEELVQLALSEDIKCQEQIIMWEVAKKPEALLDSAGELPASHFKPGSVRLQTLIDKVLDSSLSSHGPSSSPICNRQKESIPLKQTEVIPQSKSKFPQTSLKDELKGDSSKDKLEPASKNSRICFKDHIEKILLENLLSCDEEERVEALKSEGKSTGRETSSDTQKNHEDSSLRVQNIVDQVIHLTHSTRDLRKSAQAGSNVSSDISSVSNNRQRLHDQRKALLEAQRLSVQREHLSSTVLSQKRGRPHLNSMSSSNSYPSEPTKDLMPVHYDVGFQDSNGALVSKELRDDSHAGIQPLFYATHSSLQHDVQAGISPQVSPQIANQSTGALLQQKRFVAQQSSEPLSSGRLSLPTSYPGYPPHPYNDFQDRKSRHLSHQAPYLSNPFQSNHHSYVQSSKAPPPLILANQVQDIMFSNPHFLSTTHAPTKSCPCHSCVFHFSRTQAQPDLLLHQQRPFQHLLDQNRASGDPVSHTSKYNPYPTASPRRNSNETFGQSMVTTNDTISAVTFPKTFETPQRENGDTSTDNLKEARPSAQIASFSDLNLRRDNTQHVHQAALLDLRFSKDQHKMPRNIIQPSFAYSKEESSKKLSSDNARRPVLVDGGSAAISAGRDTDLPLDLSVKASSVQSPDTGLCLDYRTDPFRQDSRLSVQTSLLRQHTTSDTSAKSKGHYMEKTRQGPAGDHLQRLENSVDKLLPLDHHQAQSHMSLKHSPLPDVKCSPATARPDGGGREYSVYTCPDSRSHELAGPLTAQDPSITQPHRTSHSPLSQQQSHVSISHQQPHYSLSQQQPHLSMSKQQSNLSMSQQQPHESLSQQQPHLPMSQQQSHLSMSQQQSHLSMSQQQLPYVSLSQQQPHVSLLQQHAQLSMSQQQPHLSVSQQRPHFTMSQQQPHVSMSQQQPHLSVSQQQPHFTMSQHQPHLSMSQQQPHVSLQQPLYSASQQQPLYSTSQQQPLYSAPQQQPLYSASQQQPHLPLPQKQPMFLQPQPHENVAPSPGHNKSPDARQNHEILKSSDVNHMREGLCSPALLISQPGNTQPFSLGQEKKNTTMLGLFPASASAPLFRQDSISPNEDESQRLGSSIQNIIGQHAPSDILYLICRLCRQTYGSPYGFRKHVRTQHGFEPNADHTIVHTISATKTAMAHTTALDLTGESHSSQASKDEKPLRDTINRNVENPKSEPGDHIGSPSHLAYSTSSLENTKPDFKGSDLDHRKYLECAECGQTFQLNDFGSYKRHCRQHNHLRSSGAYVCHECQKSFLEVDLLKDHLLTHSSSSPTSPSVCDICQSCFLTVACLEKHMQTAHASSVKREEEKIPSCDFDIIEGGRTADRNQRPEQQIQQPVQAGSNQIRSWNSLPNQSASSVNLYKSPLDSQTVLTSSHSSSVTNPSSANLYKSPLDGQSILTSSANLYKSPLDSQSVLTSSHSSSVTNPSSANHSQPVSNYHSSTRLFPKDTHMLTVHTPKDLEVQKLPADGIVTTASPDSSYDEAKYLLDAQAGSSSSLKSPLSAETQTSSDSDLSKDGSSSTHRRRSSHSLEANLSQKGKVSCQMHHKDDAELAFPKPGVGVDSNRLSLDEPCSPSLEQEDMDAFYKHKKYSRHRKRLSSSYEGTEPETKSLKPEEDNPALRQFPQAVSSTVGCAVVVQDCQSSSTNIEDSSLAVIKPNRTDRQKDTNSTIEKTRQSSELST